VKVGTRPPIRMLPIICSLLLALTQTRKFSVAVAVAGVVIVGLIVTSGGPGDLVGPASATGSATAAPSADQAPCTTPCAPDNVTASGALADALAYDREILVQDPASYHQTFLDHVSTANYAIDKWGWGECAAAANWASASYEPNSAPDPGEMYLHAHRVVNAATLIADCIAGQ
jgi:hypothetical protein